jgi:hypothetical protein
LRHYSLVISCKYALLPNSVVSDGAGMMYRGNLKVRDLGRTLVQAAWKTPKNPQYSDLLRMELEHACLVADVDLTDAEVNIGSAQAAAVVRMCARGNGLRAAVRVDASPEVVSGKELLAALIETHFGRAQPTIVNPILDVIAVAYALVGPLCRAWVGAPMFGGSTLSHAAAASLFFYSYWIFHNNLGFTFSLSWDFRRRRYALESLSNMVRYPGESLNVFLPPKTKPENKPKRNAERKAAPALAKNGEGGNANVNAEEEEAQAEAEECFKEEEKEEEGADMAGMRRAGAEGGAVLIDVKDPASCLCWSLVRRGLVLGDLGSLGAAQQRGERGRRTHEKAARGLHGE